MKKKLSQMIADFEQQITNIEFRTNPGLKEKLDRLKSLVAQYELFEAQSKLMKGMVSESK